jgi:integrase
MKTTMIPEVANGLYDRMITEGYGKEAVSTAQWIISHFKNYCVTHELDDAGIPEAALFVDDCFGFDYYNPVTGTQKAVRRPLLILFEFEESGSFFRLHQKPAYAEIPLVFTDLFLAFREDVTSRKLSPSTQRTKLDMFVQHLLFLYKQGIETPKDFAPKHLYDYFELLAVDKSKSTMAGIKSVIRDAYNWMYNSGYVSFSGDSALPYIRKDPRDKLISYYSREEIDQLLSCIDTTTDYGKCVYAVICLIAHLGLRAGDVVQLKFSNIDWNNNLIRINQQKTGEPLLLPLVDEVKYPLIDYIKNARPDSIDKEYIFISINTPHRRYACTSALHRMVTYSLKIAGIEFEGRHHGPHALRHTLATNLMNENVPLSSISSILGHKSVMATEHYLTVDEKHLKELTLEVPHE